MTDWHALAHVLMPRLAAHPARTMDASRASCCVVASPTYTTLRRAGEIVQSRECRVNAAHTPGRLAALGAEKCAGKPIVVIDGADGDGANTALCTAMSRPPSAVTAVCTKSSAKDAFVTSPAIQCTSGLALPGQFDGIGSLPIAAAAASEVLACRPVSSTLAHSR